MSRWILASVVIACVAAAPALAHCGYPHGAEACDGKPQMMSGCGHAPAGAAGCGGHAGPAAKHQCGPMGMGACGPQGARMKHDCCGEGRLHSSHDPSNIWYRGPAPDCTLFDCLKGGCGPRGMAACGPHGMKACGPMGKAGCGPMGKAGCGPMGKAGCGSMGKADCAPMSKAHCGPGAAMGQGHPACGGPMGATSARGPAGAQVMPKKIPMKAGACGGAGALGASACGGAMRAAGGCGVAPKPAGGAKRAGSWETGWKGCAKPASGACCHG